MNGDEQVCVVASLIIGFPNCGATIWITTEVPSEAGPLKHLRQSNRHVFERLNNQKVLTTTGCERTRVGL
jgi:hypothetical protein